MKEALEALRSYQEVISRVDELNTLLASRPPEVVALENEWTLVQERLKDLESRKETTHTELLELNKDLEEAQGKSAKFEKDLHEVTNNKEYHAVLKEIDTAKKKVNSLQEQVNTKQETHDKILADIEENTQLEKESKKKFDDALATHTKSLSDYAVELKQKTAIRDNLAEKVPVKLMRQFTRIAERRKGVGLAMCINASCQACHVRVRPNVVDNLRRYARIYNCESCKRILVYSEEG